MDDREWERVLNVEYSKNPETYRDVPRRKELIKEVVSVNEMINQIRK